MYVCMYVCMYVYIYIHICMYINICICMYIYKHTCMHACMQTDRHTYIYTLNPRELGVIFTNLANELGHHLATMTRNGLQHMGSKTGIARNIRGLWNDRTAAYACNKATWQMLQKPGFSSSDPTPCLASPSLFLKMDKMDPDNSPSNMFTIPEPQPMFLSSNMATLSQHNCCSKSVKPRVRRTHGDVPFLWSVLLFQTMSFCWGCETVVSIVFLLDDVTDGNDVLADVLVVELSLWLQF